MHASLPASSLSGLVRVPQGFSPLSGSSRPIQVLQGTTGKELMKLTDDILTQIGIKNPLHRMQLVNTRDDLLAQQEQDTAVSPARKPTPAAGNAPLRDGGSPLTGSPVTSKPSSPNPSFVAPLHSPKVQSATECALAATS